VWLVLFVVYDPVLTVSRGRQQRRRGRGRRRREP